MIRTIFYYFKNSKIELHTSVEIEEFITAEIIVVKNSINILG